MIKKTTLFGTAAIALVLAMMPGSAKAQYGDYVVSNDTVDVDLSVLDDIGMPAPASSHRSYADTAGANPDTIIISSEGTTAPSAMPPSRISAPALQPMSPPVASAPAPLVAPPQEISPIPMAVPVQSVSMNGAPVLTPPPAVEPQPRVLKRRGPQKKTKSDSNIGIISTGAPVTYPRSEESMSSSYRPSTTEDQFSITGDIFKTEAEAEERSDNEPRRIIKKKRVVQAPVETVTEQETTKIIRRRVPVSTEVVPPVATIPVSAVADKQMQAIERSMSQLAPNASKPDAAPYVEKKTVKTKTVIAKPVPEPVFTPMAQPLPVQAPTEAPAPVSAPAPVAIVPVQDAAPPAAAAPVFKPAHIESRIKPAAPVPLAAVSLSAPVPSTEVISAPPASPALLGTQLPVSAPASAPGAVTTTTTSVEKTKTIEEVASIAPVIATATADIPVSTIEAPQNSGLVDKTAKLSEASEDLSVPPPFIPKKEDLPLVPAMVAAPSLPKPEEEKDSAFDKTAMGAPVIVPPVKTANKVEIDVKRVPIGSISEPVVIAPPKDLATKTTPLAAPEASATLVSPPAAAPVAAAIPVKSAGNLYSVTFTGDEAKLSAEDQDKIKAMASRLPADDQRITIKAYATGNAADATLARRVSLARSLAVRSLLMDNGMNPARIDVRALGSESDQKPLDRIDIIFPK